VSESQQDWVRLCRVFFAMEHGTLLKECVVASCDTSMVELEDLVSDLGYVW